MADIRQAVIGDLDGIMTIYAEAFPDDSALRYRRDDLATMIERGAGRCHIAVAADQSDGQIVGFVVAYDMVIWAYLDMVAVAPAARGDGVGSALVRHVQGLNPDWAGVWAFHTPSNVASQRTFDGAGYVRGYEQLVWRFKDLEHAAPDT